MPREEKTQAQAPAPHRAGQGAPAQAQTTNATLAKLKRTPGFKAQSEAVSPGSAHAGQHGDAGHGTAEHVDHAAHLAHQGHLAAEGAEFAGHQVGHLARYAVHEAAARKLMEAHSRMAADLRRMRRGIKALAATVANGGSAKAAAKLAEARAALEAATEAYSAEKASVANANRFVSEFKQGAANLKGAAAARLGQAAASLEAALQGSRIGRGLLSTGKLLSSPAFVRGLMVVGAALEGVAGYVDSPATTTGGKVANAALGAGGGALVMANPLVAGADMLAPKGYKLSEVYRGTAGALAAIGEGVATGDTRAMDTFHQSSKSGKYGKVMQTASEAGDYWAEKGLAGGLAEFADALKWWWDQ